jgi:phosphopantothenoylcysteine decarboxylase/phosphopantothenate--cysteine ligase
MALIALGVSGGVGAYKAVEVARGLQKRGHDIVAVMTSAAQRFVGPLTFEAITRRAVITDQFEPGINANVEHIAVASDIALLLVAPATANIIGKFTHGIADDFLSSLYLATPAPVMIAPSMNVNMLAHPAVQQNLATLRSRGVHVVEPGEGYLACGWIGKGRLAEPEEIVTAVERLLTPSSALRGRRLLVTAGPTYEDLDPVRYIGNRSSGRMGFAIAAEAVRRGARVTLVAGPTTIEPPAVEELVRVRRAVEMHQAVMTRVNGDVPFDAIIMAAAVADYAPAATVAHKISKTGDDLALTLARTPDILADVGRTRAGHHGGPVLVGFAAESEDLVARAEAKRVKKQADFIVANNVLEPGAGFDVETNIVTVVGPDGAEALPRQSKAAVAAAILDRVEKRLGSGGIGEKATGR